jgi:hypothetical protein
MLLVFIVLVLNEMVRVLDLQITVNRFDQPSASQQFKQPSSTSTKKSDAMHDFSPTKIPEEPKIQKASEISAGLLDCFSFCWRCLTGRQAS